jgi:signal peptide peptidase SppA
MPFDLITLRRYLPTLPGRVVPPLVAVVRMFGIIAGGQMPWIGPTLNLAQLGGLLERAFSIPRLKAVALTVNSPGGSAVQAALLARRIRQLSAEKKVPVVAFAEDIAASGGYWLAAAADEIFADANSIIGSIGVIRSGFGFPELLQRLGIERRVRAFGDKKSFHDPFRPEKPDDIERLDKMMREMHQNFIEYVRERRGPKLKSPEDPDLFSGEFWSGARAMELGLIDGLGDLHTVLRARYGEKLKLLTVVPPRGLLRRFGLAPIGRQENMVQGLLAELEARAMWARYGL